MSSAEQLATVTPFPGAINSLPPLANQNNIASELPEFDFGIDDIEVGKTRYFDGGAHIDRHYRFSNGAEYVGRLTISHSGLYEPPLSHRLPWCTELNGLYTDVDEEHARRGSTSIRVSPERTSVLKAAKNLGDALWGDNNMLARDAYTQHLILDDIDLLGITAPGQAIETGDSKAAMTNPAVQAYAARFGRLILYSHNNDPCVEHALTAEDFTPEAVIKNMKYLLVDEPRELLRAIRTHPIHKIPQLAQTSSLRPGFWLQQVATGPALFSGKSGGFPEHMPNDSVTSIRLFRHSEFNHALGWLRRFAPFKGIYVFMEDGSHMSLADSRIQLSTIEYVEVAQQQIKDGVKPSELSAEQIVNEVNLRRTSFRSGRSNHAARRPVQTVS